MHTMEQIVDSVPGLPILNAPVPQMASGDVGDVLGPWEPLPPQAQVWPRLEPAVGAHQDLAPLGARTTAHNCGSRQCVPCALRHPTDSRGSLVR